jgi:cytochrome c554/c'-like protein
MIAACRFLGIAAIVLALGWAAVAAVRSVSMAAIRSVPTNGAPESSPPRGAVSPVSAGCSASRCHGGAIPADADKRPDETWRWAATVWSMSDAHQRAYEVLEGPLSIAIGKHLGLKPTESARCLVCHSDPSLSNHAAEPAIVQARSEGVGCRACHGDPSKWLAAHLTWGPKDDRLPEYKKVGMTWMNDLPSRAAVCVGCHVGAPPVGDIAAKDVDHDLIAAGHPRLNFDFATYQRMMPPHWSEKDRRTHGSAPANFAVRAWSAGRLAEMQGALDLLAYRSDVKNSHPWPEFTEFNCYDCHHDLQAGGRKADAAGGARGRFGWYRAGELRLLGAKDPVTAFLQAMGTPAPVREQVHQLVPAVKSSLKAPPDSPAELLGWIAADEAKYPRPNWDQAAWMYQALVAIEIDRRGHAKGKSTDLDAEFDKLRDKLRLDVPSESPRWNSPHSFDPSAIRPLLVDLSKQLRRDLGP